MTSLELDSRDREFPFSESGYLEIDSPLIVNETFGLRITNWKAGRKKFKAFISAPLSLPISVDKKSDINSENVNTDDSIKTIPFIFPYNKRNHTLFIGDDYKITCGNPERNSVQIKIESQKELSFEVIPQGIDMSKYLGAKRDSSV